MDTGIDFDRTRKEHRLGKFDIDFRDQHAGNVTARQWTYGGTAKTYDQAMRDQQKIRRLTLTMETRIVAAESGRIVWTSTNGPVQ